MLQMRHFTDRFPKPGIKNSLRKRKLENIGHEVISNAKRTRFSENGNNEVSEPECNDVPSYHETLTSLIKGYIKLSTTAGLSVFKGRPDNFNGVTVDTRQEKVGPSELEHKIEESLEKWKTDCRRVIWFQVDINDSYFIPILAKNGFIFHHVQDGYLVMYKWLPVDRVPNLPPASHTNIGVGAMVFKGDEILAISEKHYKYPHWKLPGGYVEKGENLIAAAQREVKEETGIDSEFESLVTFRHTHNMMFGNSDIYTLLRMRATSECITIPEREINECKWMKIEEYLNHEHVHLWNKKVVLMALDHKENNIKLNIVNKTVKFAVERNINYLNLEDIS